MTRLAVALLLALPLAAQESIERLATLADVWSEVKYLHPHMMMRTIDWDGALVRAIPKVREAKDDAEFANAVGAMLAELSDPATRVVREDANAKPTVPFQRMDGDVLVLNLGAHATPDGAIWSSGAAVSQEIAKATRVVIDLRGQQDNEGIDYVLRNGGLTTRAVPVPPSLFVFHSGYASQDGMYAGSYYSALQLVPAATIPAPMRVKTRMLPPPGVVFVTDGRNLPQAAGALWWSGAAAIVSETPLTGDALAGTRRVKVADGWSAHLRVSQLAVNGLTADAVSDDPMAKALELVRGSGPYAPRPAMEPAQIDPRNLLEERHVSMTAPDLPHRLLALFRLWTIIDRFYPYKHLIGDWDQVLRMMIPRFEQAEDEKKYAAAVLETVALIHDGHSFAFGHPAVASIFGAAFQPPVQLRLVENRYVVTTSESDALKIGDVVVAVDGEPLRERVQRLRKYMTASTEVTRTNRILGAALIGDEHTEAVLTLRNDDGSTREARVKRQRYAPPPPDPRPRYRVLDGNIGYVDMPRLEMGDVDAMFDALKDTKAIIFDMRGYPRGTAWAIAPRINTKGAKIGASFRRAQVTAWSSEEAQGGYFFDQLLPPNIGDKPLYTKPTATLIDDRAISHAEHSCLFFEAANGTTFIGTHTAGANGDVTNFPLPGGFRVMFTGHDVRHADGRQLQRIGIVPHIVVELTIRGLREGKDEVLERGIAWANEATRGQ